MDQYGIINKNKTAFVCIDIQEKFVPVINNVEQVVKNANILVQASTALKVPLIVTEQYTKGLGKTVDSIKIPEGTKVIEKVHFSCFGCEEFVKTVNDMKLESMIIFGVETHVCLLKTALEGLKHKMDVYLVADAVSSRTVENKQLGIERMRQSGVYIVSTEMILFQLLEYAGTDEFKQISKLIK